MRASKSPSSSDLLSTLFLPQEYFVSNTITSLSYKARPGWVFGGGYIEISRKFVWARGGCLGCFHL